MVRDRPDREDRGPEALYAFKRARRPDSIAGTRGYDRHPIVLTLLGFAMVATFITLIMMKRLSALVALIVVPGPGPMMLEGVRALAPTGVLSPLVPSTYLLVGMAKIELGEHQRFTLPWALGACAVMLAAALLFGIFPLRAG